MKKIPILLLAVLLIGFGASPASATAVLYDWYIDVNGDVYDFYPDTYRQPVVDGAITAVSEFSMSTPNGDPYGFEVPSALGSLTVTFDPGVAGDYYIDSFFDIEIDEWVNTWWSESGAAVGSEALGQYGMIDDFDGDIAWYMGWKFTLDDNEQAVITFGITSQAPGGSFYLSQTEDDTGETIFLSSTLEFEGSDPGTAPVPNRPPSCSWAPELRD